MPTLFDDPADDSDHSLENLNEKIEKFKRDESQSAISSDDGNRSGGEAEIETDNDSQQQQNNLNLINQRQSHESDSESSDSDDGSIFDKLRNEVQHVMYNERGPRAVLNRFSDNLMETNSN